MQKQKKLIATIIMCCGIAAAWAWVSDVASINQKHLRVSAELKPTRRDPFAQHLQQKMMKVVQNADHHARPVIFDTDAASDDALALILIGSDPGIRLLAITVAGTGEAHGKPGANNMAALMKELGKPLIPVAYGRATALSDAGHSFPDSIRKAMDHLLLNTTVKQNTNAIITSDAVALMHQAVTASAEKVTILATGPLTNIAEFFHQYPTLKNKVGEIVIMGGAITVPGNIKAIAPEASNDTAEWNFYADPEAVQQVFAAGVPVTLIALDATNQVPLTRKFYEAISTEDEPELKLAHQLIQPYVKLLGEKVFFREFYMWDPLAAMVLIDPSVAETKMMSLNVNPSDGSLKVVKRGTKGSAIVKVVTKVHQPSRVLMNYVAMVKSNHLFVERKFNQAVSRTQA